MIGRVQATMGAMARKHPPRYVVDRDRDAILCCDWPSIQLHVERGLTIDADKRD